MTLLIQSGRLAESRLDLSLGTADLTFVKWRALDTLIKEGEPIPLGMLAERLNCVKSNVTQLIDRLEAEGIVRRVADPADRRSTRVELTDAGREMHRSGREALESGTQALFAQFPQSERETLRHLLLRLREKPTE